MAALEPSNTSAYILVATISGLTTIVVAKIGQHVAPKIKMSNMNSHAGYDKWAAYMQRELEETQDKLTELQSVLEKFKEQLYEEKQLNKRMRTKLLWFSRKFNVDVSDLV